MAINFSRSNGFSNADVFKYVYLDSDMEIPANEQRPILAVYPSESDLTLTLNLKKGECVIIANVCDEFTVDVQIKGVGTPSTFGIEKTYLCWSDRNSGELNSIQI